MSRLKRQERGSVFWWHGPAEQVTLALRAAETLQIFELLLALDPFSGRVEPQAVRQLHDRPEDGLGIEPSQIVDEGPINLDLVEGKISQGAQR